MNENSLNTSSIPPAEVENIPPQQTNAPTPTVPEIPQHIVSSQQNTPKKSKLKKYFFIATLIFIVLATLGIFFFRKPSNVKAKEYLMAVGDDLTAISERLNFYKEPFVEVSESLETSKEAYYEITKSRDYFSAVEDTKQDIQDIQNTIDLIQKAQKIRQEIEDLPTELEMFDQRLNDYYQNSLQALTLLLQHEEFQMRMLLASGSEMNSSLKEFENLVNNKTTTMNELANSVQVLAELTQESSDNFDGLENIPDFEKGYYELMKNYHNDLAATMRKSDEYLKLGTDKGNYLFALEAVEFSQRTLQSNSKRDELSKEWLEESEIKLLFQKASEAESQIAEEFDELVEEYEVEIVVPTQFPTPTSFEEAKENEVQIATTSSETYEKATESAIQE